MPKDNVGGFPLSYFKTYYKKPEIKTVWGAGFSGGSVIKNAPASAGDTLWFLVWEDPTCREQLGPCTTTLSLCLRAQEPQLLKSTHPRACAAPQEKPLQREVCTPQSSPHSSQLEKRLCSYEDPAQLKTNRGKGSMVRHRADTQCNGTESE